MYRDSSARWTVSSLTRSIHSPKRFTSPVRAFMDCVGDHFLRSTTSQIALLTSICRDGRPLQPFPTVVCLRRRAWSCLRANRVIAASRNTTDTLLRSCPNQSAKALKFGLRGRRKLNVPPRGLRKSGIAFERSADSFSGPLPLGPTAKHSSWSLSTAAHTAPIASSSAAPSATSWPLSLRSLTASLSGMPPDSAIATSCAACVRVTKPSGINLLNLSSEAPPKRRPSLLLCISPQSRVK